MDLMDLVVLACTLASPEACHEYHLLYQSAGSPRTCTMQAQPYLAQWIGEHPNLRVARWDARGPARKTGRPELGVSPRTPPSAGRLVGFG